MGLNLFLFGTRSLISILLGVAHVYFVILGFGSIHVLNPIPELIVNSDLLKSNALLWVSIFDLLIHLVLCIPAVLALFYLQKQLKYYHLCLLALPMACFSFYNLFKMYGLQDELELTFLSYLNTLLPTLSLMLIGLLAIRHIKPKGTSQLS